MSFMSAKDNLKITQWSNRLRCLPQTVHRIVHLWHKASLGRLKGSQGYQLSKVRFMKMKPCHAAAKPSAHPCPSVKCWAATAESSCRPLCQGKFKGLDQCKSFDIWRGRPTNRVGPKKTRVSYMSLRALCIFWSSRYAICFHLWL